VAKVLRIATSESLADNLAEAQQPIVSAQNAVRSVEGYGIVNR
jgi:hypothetical protein